jgi:hypothetical protein
MCSQRHRIGRGHDRSVDVLSRMMSDTNPTIDPERAHWGEKVCILWSQPIRKKKEKYAWFTSAHSSRMYECRLLRMKPERRSQR